MTNVGLVSADIPLLPAMTSKGGEPNFVVHWLNNKELHFSMEADKILSDLHKRAVGTGEETETNDSDTANNDTDDGPDLISFEVPTDTTSAGSENGEKETFSL